eukprot:3120441-Rhodomonas_salina.1
MRRDSYTRGVAGMRTEGVVRLQNSAPRLPSSPHLTSSRPPSPRHLARDLASVSEECARLYVLER